MPHFSTYEFTAFTEADLLEARFDFEDVPVGDYREDVDLFGAVSNLKSGQSAPSAMVEVSVDGINHETVSNKSTVDTVDLIV